MTDAEYLEITTARPDDEAGQLECFLRAGRRGDPDGDYYAALLFDSGGSGVPVDHARANRCYRRAIRGGVIEASGNYGINLLDGRGCRLNPAEGFKHLHFAAESGDETAFRNLAECYYFGEGCRINYRRAFHWYVRSRLVTRNPADAGNIGDGYMRGRGVKRNRRKAFLWFKKGAKNGDIYAAFHLALHYLHGLGTARDIEAARYWLGQVLAVNPDDVDTLYWLGRSWGEGYHQAMPCFEQAWRLKPSPWIAWRMARLQLRHHRQLSPELLSETEKLLRYTAKHRLGAARRLLASCRWQEIKDRSLRSTQGAPE